MAKKLPSKKFKTIGPVRVTNQQEYDAFMASAPSNAVLIRIPDPETAPRVRKAKKGQKPKVLFYYSGTWYGTFWG